MEGTRQNTAFYIFSAKAIGNSLNSICTIISSGAVQGWGGFCFGNMTGVPNKTLLLFF